MTITQVNSSTFLADTVNLIRDKLNSNITDPLGSRASGERFVMTSYPQRAVRYPLITIVDAGNIQEQRLGMCSEGTAVRVTVEIRIWGRDVKERDELFDAVYEWLRTNQFGGSDALTDANLHDFSLNSVVNVDESGQEGVKSKVMEVQFIFVAQ